MSERPRRGKCPTAGSREVYARVCGEFLGLQRHSQALAAGSLDNGEQTSECAAGPAAMNYYSSL